jgi:phosphoribosyl-ATP pyrophosphohydrolase
MSGFNLNDLAVIVSDRQRANFETSYTKTLLDAGVGRCAKKFGEEAVEAVIAAVDQNRGELIKETADVLYHLLVLLEASKVPLQAVYDELESRTSQSGLEEKASRSK